MVDGIEGSTHDPDSTPFWHEQAGYVACAADAVRGSARTGAPAHRALRRPGGTAAYRRLPGTEAVHPGQRPAAGWHDGRGTDRVVTCVTYTAREPVGAMG
ncbi:hypothetical protein GCM10027199_34290 [Amycolatopsis magusensis]